MTGAGLDAQWRAWEKEAAQSFSQDVRERQEAGLTAARALTARGVRQVGPRYSPDGAWIAYTSGTLTRFPELRLVRPDGSEDRPLALRNGGSSAAWTPDSRALVVAELQVHGTFSVFSDLSLVEVPSGRVRRLTRGARAYDPDVSPDGRTVVFARRLGDRSELFSIGIDGGGARPADDVRARASSGAARASAPTAARSSPRGCCPGAGSTSCASTARPGGSTS